MSRYKLGKDFKQYKKSVLKDYKKYEKPTKWRQRWLPFIKYDKDFDGFYFIALIVYKLHLMLDFYSNPANCMQVDESRLLIVKSLTEACELGDAIVNDSFFDQASDILMKHKNIYIEGSNKFHSNWDSEENEKLYRKLEQEAQENRRQTIKKFFKLLCNHYEDWWD